jgi:tRNA (mo5U34)-methyltransferase
MTAQEPSADVANRLAELEEELDAVRTRYEALRKRKAVQMALRLADLRHRVPRITSRLLSTQSRSADPTQSRTGESVPGRPAPVATSPSRSAMNISNLLHGMDTSKAHLADARRAIGGDFVWYQYDILGNLWHLNELLHDENRDLGRLAGERPVADIGAADGDLAFMLERMWGWEIDIVDNAATNQNGLRAASALRDHFGSRARILDIDLDTQFSLPRERYGLVFLLGILYHLQNPFYALRQLARQADYCLLSTKVARFAGVNRARLSELPVAYLVNPTETNNDPTNYWIFTPAGLERIAIRAGWNVLESISVGDVVASDPSSPEHDERTFMLLRS